MIVETNNRTNILDYLKQKAKEKKVLNLKTIDAQNEIHTIHITHIDSDAVGSDVLVRLFYCNDDENDVQTYFCGNNKVDEVIDLVVTKVVPMHPECRRIIVSDIGPSKESCDKLEVLRITKKIIVEGFDHHITNKMDLCYPWFKVKQRDFRYTEREGNAGVKYFNENLPKKDQFISACMVMLIDKLTAVAEEIDGLGDTKPHISEYNSINYFLYRMISDISRYDTWEWKINPSEKGDENRVADLCNIYGPDIATLHIFEQVKNVVFNDDNFPFPDANKLDEIDYISDKDKSLIEAIHIEKQNEIDDSEFRVHVTEMSFNGNNINYRIGLYLPNHPMYCSEVCNYVLSNHKNIDFIIGLHADNLHLSFRTEKDCLSMPEFANTFGNGGGHLKAAGCTCSLEMFMELFQMYHHSETLSEYSNKV